MTAKRWEHRLWDCQQQAAQLVADRDRLIAAIDKAWRLLDTGDAYGKDATAAMLMLQEAVEGCKAPWRPAAIEALPEPFCAEPCKHVSCNTIRQRLTSEAEVKP